MRESRLGPDTADLDDVAPSILLVLRRSPERQQGIQMAILL